MEVRKRLIERPHDRNSNIALEHMISSFVSVRLVLVPSCRSLHSHIPCLAAIACQKGPPAALSIANIEDPCF